MYFIFIRAYSLHKFYLKCNVMFLRINWHQKTFSLSKRCCCKKHSVHKKLSESSDPLSFVFIFIHINFTTYYHISPGFFVYDYFCHESAIYILDVIPTSYFWNRVDDIRKQETDCRLLFQLGKIASEYRKLCAFKRYLPL